MIKAIAVDDEPLALEVIRKYSADTPLIKLVHTFTDAVQALAYLKVQAVELLILDIQMPDISGIQFVQSLKTKPMVIFTTAYAEYAVKGFDLEAVDYLVKPIRFERFLTALGKAAKYKDMTLRRQQPQEDEDYLFVKSGYGNVRIILSEVLYIESFDDYLQIHFADARQAVTSQMSLKSILERLPANRFMRVHRSFIVSLGHIRSIRNKVIWLGDIRIPVGDTYSDVITDWLSGK